MSNSFLRTPIDHFHSSILDSFSFPQHIDFETDSHSSRSAVSFLVVRICSCRLAAIHTMIITCVGVLYLLLTFIAYNACSERFALYVKSTHKLQFGIALFFRILRDFRFDSYRF
eukprot:328467_1